MFRRKNKEENKVMEYLKKEERVIRRRSTLNRVLILFFFIGSLGGIYAFTLETSVDGNVKSEDIEFISEESFVLKYVYSYFSSDTESIDFVKNYSSSLVTKPTVSNDEVNISHIDVAKVENNYEDGYYIYFGQFKLNEELFSYKLNLCLDEYLVLNNIEFKEYEYEMPLYDSTNKIDEIFANYIDLTKEEHDEYDELIKLFFTNYSSDYNSVKVMYDKVEPLHENIVYDLDTLKILNGGKNTESEVVLLNVSVDTNVVTEEVNVVTINYNYLIKIDKNNNKIILVEQII